MLVTTNGIIMPKWIAAHTHFRDDVPEQPQILSAVVPFANEYASDVIVLPNLRPPIVDLKDAEAYKARIIVAGARFQPHMTLKLVQNQPGAPKHTTPQIIIDAARGGVDKAKLYPCVEGREDNVTTNADHGVFDLEQFGDELSAMQEVDMALLIHGECPHSQASSADHIDIAEENYIPKIIWTRRNFPHLRICVCHVSTAVMLSVIRQQNDPDHLVGELAIQHMTNTHADVWPGGHISPHQHCKPAAKTEHDRSRITEAATSGEPFWMNGNDSAPHLRANKGKEKPAAGCFNDPSAACRILEAFTETATLRNIMPFVRRNAERFYRIPPTNEEIEFVHKSWTVPSSYPVPGTDDVLVPWDAGRRCRWQLYEVST